MKQQNAHSSLITALLAALVFCLILAAFGKSQAASRSITHEQQLSFRSLRHTQGCRPFSQVIWYDLRQAGGIVASLAPLFPPEPEPSRVLVVNGGVLFKAQGPIGLFYGPLARYRKWLFV